MERILELALLVLMLLLLTAAGNNYDDGNDLGIALNACFSAAPGNDPGNYAYRTADRCAAAWAAIGPSSAFPGKNPGTGAYGNVLLVLLWELLMEMLLKLVMLGIMTLGMLGLGITLFQLIMLGMLRKLLIQRIPFQLMMGMKLVQQLMKMLVSLAGWE